MLLYVCVTFPDGPGEAVLPACLSRSLPRCDSEVLWKHGLGLRNGALLSGRVVFLRHWTVAGPPFQAWKHVAPLRFCLVLATLQCGRAWRIRFAGGPRGPIGVHMAPAGLILGIKLIKEVSTQRKWLDKISSGILKKTRHRPRRRRPPEGFFPLPAAGEFFYFMD